MNEDVELSIITRFSNPTNLDYLPYGTIIKIPKNDESECQYYIQSGKESNKPKWITSAELFELIFNEFIPKDRFVSECLNILDKESENYSLLSLMLLDLSHK
jgi:hypothetical protein